MTRLVLTSDLHGNLPTDLPEGDILIIAGDICPDFSGSMPGTRQSHWLDDKFRAWLLYLEPAYDAIIGIAGNHDFAFEQKALIPKGLHWIYLEDSEARIGDLRFWGTPWVPNLQSWAFYASEAALEARANLIPEGIDVIISHDPPWGAGDYLMSHGHIGDTYVGEAARRVGAKLIVCGHIHEGYGSYKAYDTHVRNVSYVNQNYVAGQQPPMVFDV